MELRDRWPLPDRPDLRDRLLAAYADGDRGYHDVRHLGEVLDRLEELGCTDITVVLAAWFHDAVYGVGEDEERSARLVESELGGRADVAEIARLVRMTATHLPDDADRPGQLLSDADLAILAAPPDRYAEYVAGVRAEYAHVADAEFRAGRAAILHDLLAKPSLFHTAEARRRWETAARANVEGELAELIG